MGRKYLGWLLRRSPGDWPFLFLFVMTLVSLAISPLPEQSLRAAVPLIVGFVAYALMARWPITPSRLGWSWWGLTLAGALLSFLGPPGMLPLRHAAFRWLPAWDYLRSHLPDTFNENVIAGTLVILLPFAVARGLLGRRESSPRGWTAWMASLLASLGVLLVLALTSSRGAYLAACVSLLLLVGLAWPKAWPALIPLGAVAALACGMLVGWRQMAHILFMGGTARTLKQRAEIWSRALYIIRDFPLTGAGIGCFQSLVKRLYPLFLIPRGTVSHAHNLYLQVAVDLGLPSLFAYLVLLGLSFCLALRAYRRFTLSKERPLALLSAACLASLAGMCVHGLIDAAAWGNKGAFIPWIVMGLCTALTRFSLSLDDPCGNSNCRDSVRQVFRHYGTPANDHFGTDCLVGDDTSPHTN